MWHDRGFLLLNIIDDLISRNKLALCLFGGIAITAVGIVWQTHQTRLLVTEQGQLIQANNKLENQYVHLRLEESARGNKARVEAAAIKFGLQRIKKEQEIILVE